MRIDWKPDNRPDAAERIAAHTQAIIKAMDDATSAGQVKAIFDDWCRYAREHRVCQPVVDHVVGKRAELVGDFEKSKTRTMTEASRRMMGDTQ